MASNSDISLNNVNRLYFILFFALLFQDMVRRGEIIDDATEDEFYLRRLDAGLFVLQLICYIMVEISNAGIPQVRGSATLQHPCDIAVVLREGWHLSS